MKGINMSKNIPSNNKKNLFELLQEIFNKNNHQKLGRSGNVSHKTRDDRAHSIKLGFEELLELGFKIENPYNLSEKHIVALAQYWEHKQLAASTIQTRLSAFRNFAIWIGKKGMIKDSVVYVKDKKSVTRSLAAQSDKSWTGNQIDVDKAIANINAFDPFVGIQLKMIRVFGLRRKEAIMLQPVICDAGHVLEIRKGAKGGRSRFVLIDTELKRVVVEEAKQFVLSGGSKVNGHLGNPDLTLVQNLEHYSYVLGKFGFSKKQLGVTGHGLRAEFAIVRLVENEIEPSVRGGTGQHEDKVKTKIVYFKLVEELGHSDYRKVAAYAGKIIRIRKKKKDDPENDDPDKEDPEPELVS